MAHLVVSQEGANIGSALCQLAEVRGDNLILYAPRSLADRPREEHQHWQDKSFIRSFVEPFGLVELGRFGPAEYGVYAPGSRSDLQILFKLSRCPFGCIQVAVPSKLDLNQWDILAGIWKSVRPLRYLTQTDVCHELSVPWIYIISAYNYDPSLAIACFADEQLASQFAELVSSSGSHVWPLKEAMQGEDRVWKQNYSEFD